MAVLYGNDVLPILVLLTKKWYSSFLKKVSIFRKICFKVKVLKSFKISSACHIKTCWTLKQRPILKIPRIVFRSIYFLSVGFKTKTLRKSFFIVKTKTNPNFAVKLAERSNHSFLLSIWWITFFKHMYSLTIECIRLNWLCKYIKKVWSSQAAILVLNLVKHSFFLWVWLKENILFSIFLHAILHKVKKVYLFFYRIHYQSFQKTLADKNIPFSVCKRIHLWNSIH